MELPSGLGPIFFFSRSLVKPRGVFFDSFFSSLVFRYFSRCTNLFGSWRGPRVVIVLAFSFPLIIALSPIVLIDREESPVH